jgi:hypothetical protein
MTVFGVALGGEAGAAQRDPASLPEPGTLFRHPGLDCQKIGPDGVSGVGGRRGTNRGRLALFRPPLPKRSVHLSAHCAFQRLTTHVVGDGTTVLALGITPTALFAQRRRLCPFPL